MKLMSDYGADKNPDLNIATEVTIVQGVLPLPKTNVMQWTYPDDIFVQKYAHKKSSSNLLVKFKRS